MKGDKSKTLEQQYLDPKSFMRADGSEVLVGEDWKRRKVELWERCRGMCEWTNGENMRCMAAAADPHHVIRRSIKRIDNLWNLKGLCKFHHDQLDERKPRWSRAGRP